MKKTKTRAREDHSPNLRFKLLGFILLFLLQIGLFVLAGSYVREYVGFMLGLIPIMEFLAFIYIFNDTSNPMYKLAWVFLILSIPFFGIFIYLYATFEPRKSQMRRRFATIRNRYQGVYGKLDGKDVEQALKTRDPLVSLTANFLKNSGDFPVYDAQGVVYHPDGRVHFTDMLEELKRAERFIFLEYFILAEGLMWQSILAILKEKAAQGVEVRILLDGMQAFINLPSNFKEQMARLGIKTRIYIPVRPTFSFNQNHRDHRKIMVIDGEVAYTGGLNIADEYINEIERFGYWKDTAVKIQGDAVDSFTLMFLEVWNVIEDGLLEERFLRREKSDLKKEGFVIPYYDLPYDRQEKGRKVYLDVIHQAREYLYIMTPYFILDDEILNSLCFAAKSGVDVRIILPHIPDKPWVFYTSRTFYRELLGAGAQVFEYLPGFLHAKTFLSDGNKAVVGTINLDYRSLFLQLECGAYFYDTPVSRELEADFRETLSLSREITLEIVEDFPFHERAIGRLMRLIAPLL